MQAFLPLLTMSVFAFFGATSTCLGASSSDLPAKPLKSNKALSPIKTLKKTQKILDAAPKGPATPARTDESACPDLVFVTGSCLPPAILGQPYSIQIRASGGSPPLSFSPGPQSALPPGFNLHPNGRLYGVPSGMGKYAFRVLVSCSCPSAPRNASADFVIDVQTPELSFSGKVSPSTIKIKRGSRAAHTVTYSIDIRGGPAANVPQGTFRSYSGVFRSGRRILGQQKGTVLITLINGHGDAVESVSIPTGVFERALSERSEKEYQITYEREFESDSFSSTTRTELHISLVQEKTDLSPSERPDQREVHLRPRLQEAPSTSADKHKQVTPTRTPASTKKILRNRADLTSTAAEYVPGRVLVSSDPRKAAGVSRRLQVAYNLRPIASHAMLTNGIRVLVFETGSSVRDVLAALAGEPGVMGAQPDYVYETQSEPYAELQTITRTLCFPTLHKAHKGKGVRVAVLDTGVDSSHQDLEGRVVFNRNLVEGTPLRPEIHGTAVAGIIASEINDFGTEGIAPEAELLALRCLEQTDENKPRGKGTTSSISRALDLALIERARIINLSFGSRVQDPLISLFLQEGGKRDILFTAPIGNRAELGSPLFPASHPLVVGVGGLDQGGRALHSASLAAHARVLAPSVRLFTTLPGNRHGFQNGTSFASAVVAGILALAVEKRDDLTQEDLPPWTGDLRRWVESVLEITLENNG